MRDTRIECARTTRMLSPKWSFSSEQSVSRFSLTPHLVVTLESMSEPSNVLHSNIVRIKKELYPQLSYSYVSLLFPLLFLLSWVGET